MTASHPAFPPEIPDNSPYYTPGVVRFDPPGMETTAVTGLTMATELESGDTHTLPDGVRAWLDQHTQAVNTLGAGQLRHIIANELDTPPYTRETALRIGALLRLAIRNGNEARAQWELTEIEMTNRVKRLLGGGSTEAE